MTENVVQNKSEALSEFVHFYLKEQDQHQIINYGLANKFNIPSQNYTLLHIELQAIELKMKMIENEIRKEQERLSNEPIQNIQEFVSSYSPS